MLSLTPVYTLFFFDSHYYTYGFIMIRLVQICTTIIRNSLYNIVAMLEL